ncbi:MAG: hypothetical protein ACXACA_05745 [Candidatus Ranarchaeia archaeon]
MVNNLEEKIKEIAFESGADVVGFGPASPWEYIVGYRHHQPRGQSPVEVLPTSKSLVSIGLQRLDTYWDDGPVRLRVISGRQEQQVLNQILYRVGRFLHTLKFDAFPIIADYAIDVEEVKKDPSYRNVWHGTISDQYAAVQAGLAVIGKNHLALSPEFGPRVRFGTILTSAELSPTPMLNEDFCENCDLCEQACPEVLKEYEYFNPVACIGRTTRVGVTVPGQRYKVCPGECLGVCPVGSRRLPLPSNPSGPGVIMSKGGKRSQK